MSDSATAAPNKVTIEDAGPSRKRISIEIPAGVVESRIADSLEAVIAEAALPGFRKGHAPRRLVEKRFGGRIRDEAKQQLVAGAYQDAVRDHQLKVLGEPTSESLGDLQVADGQPLRFDVEVEVLPEFDLPQLEGIKVLRPDPTVPEDLVAQEVDKLKVNEGSLEEREQGEPGDYATGHATMTDSDGTEHYNIEGAVIRVPETDSDGSGMILGVKVDDFGTQIGSPKAGDELVVAVTGPEQHEVEALRGKDLSVTFKVARIDRIIPAPIADVVAKFGLASEEQLAEGVRQRLEQRAAIQQQAVMRQQITRHLMDGAEVDVPERVTAAQAGRNLERQRMELMYRGVDQQQIEEHMGELRASAPEAARNELKLFFIINKAADELGINVEEAELNGRVAQIAQQQGVRPEEMRQQLAKSGQIQTVFQQIREHKTLDAILTKAEIEDVSAEDFNTRMSTDG